MAYYINNVIHLLTVNSPVTGSKPTCIMCSKSTGFEISGLYALSGKSQSGQVILVAHTKLTFFRFFLFASSTFTSD